MTEYDDGITVAEVDAAFTVKIDAGSTLSGIRYCSAEASTGYRYTVVVTPLPSGALEGGPLLVTVTSPWTDAHALQRTGYLSEGYVREHLCGALSRRSHAEVRAMTLLVRHALGREGDR